MLCNMFDINREHHFVQCLLWLKEQKVISCEVLLRLKKQNTTRRNILLSLKKQNAISCSIFARLKEQNTTRSSISFKNRPKQETLNHPALIKDYLELFFPILLFRYIWSLFCVILKCTTNLCTSQDNFYNLFAVEIACKLFSCICARQKWKIWLLTNYLTLRSLTFYKIQVQKPVTGKI